MAGSWMGGKILYKKSLDCGYGLAAALERLGVPLPLPATVPTLARIPLLFSHKFDQENHY
jgi:hypothetical protein